MNVFVGGPPAMTVAAVMPLPEGLSESALAGMLGRRRVPMIPQGDRLPIYAEADFCIVGHLDPGRLLPEGPFGDHLGYYSLRHDFPVMLVERVYHRKDAIWPFTVVGRPPQEDSIFSQLVHELAGPVIPRTIPGVRAVHAVEAAGVHPLLLAIGSERYVPYEPGRRPRELLTLANALLGHGQLSLAKYLWIAAAEDNPQLDVARRARTSSATCSSASIGGATCTSRPAPPSTRSTTAARRCNEGSKVVIAAAGPPLRTLPVAIDSRLTLPEALGFRKPRVFLPGILRGGGARLRARSERRPGPRRWTASARRYNRFDAINGFPLVVVVDQVDFAARNLDNFLWTTFTRSNPAADIYGIEAFFRDKHWGCCGSLVIDARAKPHHAPPLVEDPEVTRRVDALAAPRRAAARDHLM